MGLRAEVAIVGGGILGLAHAYVAARAGKNAVLFEKGQLATGASIRNFGMIWPIGQPAGEMHIMARRSRDIWVEALQAARLRYRATGSLHVAHRPDEEDVLREFADIGPKAGYPCEWLDSAETLKRSGSIQEIGLRGSLWSEGEVTVDPREIVLKFPAYLKETGVTLRYGSAVRRIELPVLETSTERWEVDSAIVCGGDDFETLYPEVFAESGITRCKLQMLRTAPQANGWQLGPALAAGLTLRFYKAFAICSSLGPLKARIAAEKPEYEKWAIHVLASQTADGAVTLGDSHEYGLTVSPFDRNDIDDLIMREARTFLKLPSWEIAERWHGVYSLHSRRPFFETEPASGVRILTAPGGSGMTLSFGLAERTARAMQL